MAKKSFYSDNYWPNMIYLNSYKEPRRAFSDGSFRNKKDAIDTIKAWKTQADANHCEWLISWIDVYGYNGTKYYKRRIIAKEENNKYWT